MIKGKYKRIVAYGCSFTAGDELGDAIGLGIEEEHLDSLKRSGATRQEIFGNNEILEQCNSIGKDLSFVRWLADRYSIPYSNRAQSGSSLQQIIFRVERDYRIGLIKETDFVIVGITSMYRWFQFKNDGAELSWLYGHPNILDKDYGNLILENYANNYNILWNYFSSLNYLDMLSQQKTNIKFFYALKTADYELRTNTNVKGLQDDFRKTIKSFEFTSCLNPDYSFIDLYSHLPEQEATHGWKHPKLKYHRQFANLLYAWIEEKVQ